MLFNISLLKYIFITLYSAAAVFTTLQQVEPNPAVRYCKRYIEPMVKYWVLKCPDASSDWPDDLYDEMASKYLRYKEQDSNLRRPFFTNYSIETLLLHEEIRKAFLGPFLFSSSTASFPLTSLLPN